jgi:transposase
VSRLVAGLGYEVMVANPRQVKRINQSNRKDDRLDARTRALPALVNQVRGMVKATGDRVPACGTRR